MIKRNSKPNQNPSTSRGEGQTPEMNNDLYEPFLDELADVYSVEQQLIKALPKMAKAAQSDELREAFESHLEDSTALGAALIAAGRKVEHYETASFGTRIAWAEKMGHEEAVKALTDTLEEEEAAADEKVISSARPTAIPKAKAE